jgi:hypothetical protein
MINPRSLAARVDALAASAPDRARLVREIIAALGEPLDAAAAGADPVASVRRHRDAYRSGALAMPAHWPRDVFEQAAVLALWLAEASAVSEGDPNATAADAGPFFTPN